MLLAVFIMTTGGMVTGQDKDSVRYNQYGVAVDRTPLDVERRGGILVFESKDQKTRIWTDTRVQADGAVFFGDTYNPIGNGTSIRRARFAMKTSFGEHWYGEFDMDISNSELEVKDAYVKYSFSKHSEGDGLELQVGNFKEPFSMETTTTSRYLTFIERPNVVYTFGPSRHIGMMASYYKNWFLALGGIHFQNVGGLEERIFSEDANKDFGVDEGYSLTGRMVLMPWQSNNDFGIHLGVAGSYRTPTTDAEIPGSFRYSTRSLISINRKKYLDTDDIANVDHVLLGGLELAAHYKGLRFQGEYIMNNLTRENNLGKENFGGFYVFGSYLLFGGKHQYNPGDGEFTQPTRGKKWGDLEVALRYDYLDLNSRLEGVMGGASDGYTLGLNWHANDNVKVMINYAILNHDRYANGRGKLFVGYDIDGNLTKDPAQVADAAGTAGEDYSFLGVRFEIDF
jgi:phosphate-selective porin OprO/OprP